jgi:hypothetical protein
MPAGRLAVTLAPELYALVSAIKVLNSNSRSNAWEHAWFMNAEFTPVIEEVDLVLAELSQFVSAGPHFKIVHRFREPGIDGCAPGEEVAAVYLIYRAREVFVRLPLALRMLFDYLARHRHLPQSASQIEAGMKSNLFYIEHGGNAPTSADLKRKITRSAIKEYVKRVRRALTMAFDEASMDFDSFKVLVSEETVGNEVVYRLKATVEWDHLS